jgi:hypothetical protein
LYKYKPNSGFNDYWQINEETAPVQQQHSLKIESRLIVWYKKLLISY